MYKKKELDTNSIIFSWVFVLKNFFLVFVCFVLLFGLFFSF